MTKQERDTLIETRTAARVTEELDAIDMTERFNEMLDECYSFDGVGGPFAHMMPSRVLLEMDPVAHRCGVNDYADSISRDRDIEEVDGEYYQADEVETIRDEVTSEVDAETAEPEDDEDADEATP